MDPDTQKQILDVAKFNEVGEFTWGTTDDDLARGIFHLNMILGDDAYVFQNSERGLSQISRQPPRVGHPAHLWIPAFTTMTKWRCLPIWDRFL